MVGRVSGGGSWLSAEQKIIVAALTEGWMDVPQGLKPTVISDLGGAA